MHAPWPSGFVFSQINCPQCGSEKIEGRGIESQPVLSTRQPLVDGQKPGHRVRVTKELGVSERTARRRMKAAEDLEIYGDAVRDAGKRQGKMKTNN